jgi:2-polyprenyl-3-methyl-5-hydroxy-6-metoxy-1,4-benzoquinol methylase
MLEVPVTIELEDRPCPNGCTRADEFVIDGRDRLHGVAGRYRVVRCAACGLMRTNPRPAAASMGAYYPDDYAPYHTAAVASPARPGRLTRLLSLQTRIAPPITNGRLLEIGCASGAYLEQMQRDGWTVEGIEFSASAASQALGKGFAVQVATVESARAPSEPVDVIAAWMVLEHLHEPVGALRRMLSWVRPGGYLIASIPDAGALERRVFKDRWYALQLPTHLFHYTPVTLARVLDAGGWTLERITWQKNCNNLLWSLEYFAADKGWQALGRGVRWLRTAPAGGKLRVLLSWVLGVTRQSGRMEFWARPKQTPTPVQS